MRKKLLLALAALLTLRPGTAVQEAGKARPSPGTTAASPAPEPPFPMPPATGSVSARVLVTGPDGRALPASDAVVWLPGLKGPAPVPPASMASKEKRFEPRVLVVPRGASVTFPNFDRIFHNVFSLSEAAPFDLGLYRNGASRAATFDRPGVVRVYCNIHPQMAAFIVVVDGSLYARTGREGVALLEGVPAGRHALKAWEERGGEWSGAVDVPANGTAAVTVTLDASRFREQAHKNKHGRDYPPPDDDENRY